ncbi:response regulator transcription factor [Undibacterium sp. TJN19]|uniref:helix-turn-helix transcriptional regulator n=1 Tax=Undibacterium sp. TJN19 TaxID=3413055 RepID=UPI003BF42D2B
MDYNDFLLRLYRGTRDVPIDEFPEFAFAITKQVMAFDSARMMAVEVGADTATVHSSTMHNEPDSIHLDWEQISSRDTVLQSVTSLPDRSYNFNAQCLYAKRDKLIVLDYANRYNHNNGLVIAAKNSETAYWDGISLYRAHNARHFTGDEELLLELLAPHLRQAFELNRLRGMDAAECDKAMAVITPGGTLEYCTSRFAEIVSLEFPNWHGHRLPAAVLAALSRVGVMSFGGAKIRMKVRQQRGLLFVFALSDKVLARLTDRELMVARLFSQGLSYKEVARRMQIAPATARNFIQKIYVKLGVRGKGELAILIGHI